MEIKQTLKSDSISSRIKESLKGLLSIVDGNSYLVEENEEISMPEELRSSLQSLSEQERQYQETGMLNSFLKKNISQTRTKKSEIPKTKLTSSQKGTISKVTNKEIKQDDIELDR